jgi:hypothetical protein
VLQWSALWSFIIRLTDPSHPLYDFMYSWNDGTLQVEKKRHEEVEATTGDFPFGMILHRSKGALVADPADLFASVDNTTCSKVYT